MAISAVSSCFFTSPSFISHSKSCSQSISTYVKPRRAPNSAAYTTTTTAKATETQTVRSLSNTCSSSYYDLLGVRIGADTQEVKTAYRRLARVLHPDVVGIESSADEFMKVHLAYSTLSDPEKRAKYDRSFVQRRSSLRSVASGFKNRRWETDQCW